MRKCNSLNDKHDDPWLSLDERNSEITVLIYVNTDNGFIKDFLQILDFGGH